MGHALGKDALTACGNRGRLVKDRKTDETKMSCRNWECGVVMAVHGGRDQGSKANEDLGLFQGMIPVPMQVPGRAYRSKEEPWFYDGA